MKDFSPSYSSKVIHVFSWDGEPTYKIQVNKPIKEMTLDTPNHTLYIMDVEGILYAYDISEVQ